MSRARDLSRLSSPSVFSVDATDASNNKVGVGSENPTAKLNVAGIVSATAFYGDGSNLEGVSGSAGLGTALADEGLGSVIYYTENTLGIGSTFVVTVPTGSDVAYTQYAEISLDENVDLIVTDGDEFIPDVLGLSTTGITPLTGAGGRIRADFFTNKAGTGAPTFQTGVNITGVATATSFSSATGSFTGDVDIADKIVHTGDTNTAIRFPAADTFTVETGGVERVRVNSSGNIGINSTIPRSKLHVANGNSNYNPGNPTGLGAGAVASLESSGDVALQFLSSTTTDNFIYFGDTDSATTGSIQYDHNVNALSFNVSGGTERLRIDSSGTSTFGGMLKIVDTELQEASDNFSINIQSGNNDFYVKSGGTTFAAFKGSAKDLQLTSGNLVIGTSGKGIDFSATGDAGGMTSELLDDYEEGTWTPTIGGNATYTNQVGTYVKVGRMVYAHWALTINAQGTGSNMSAISGLPYSSGLASQVTSNLQWAGFGVSMAYAIYYVGNASTTMYLSYIATAAAALTNNPNGLVNGATIIGTIVYYST